MRTVAACCQGETHSLYMKNETAVMCLWTDGVFTLDVSYILMRKAVACELGGSVVEVDCAEDLNRALRMVWGSTSGVGWEEDRWLAGRDKDGGRPSFFVLLPAPGVSLNLLYEPRERREHQNLKKPQKWIKHIRIWKYFSMTPNIANLYTSKK